MVNSLILRYPFLFGYPHQTSNCWYCLAKKEKEKVIVGIGYAIICFKVDKNTKNKQMN